MSLSVMFMCRWLVLKINAFHTVANACEHLIGNGVEHIAEHDDRQVGAENLDHVALLAVDVGDVDECHVHADIAYIFRLLTVDQAVAVTVA